MKRTVIAFWRARSRRQRKLLGWAAGLVLFYTVFGFVILPFVVRAVGEKQLSKFLDRPVTIETVRLNPYVFSASIAGLVVQDKDGDRFLACERFQGNFQLSSFFGKPWVFKEIELTRPYARVQINPDRSLNFSDLLKKFSAPSKEPKPLSESPAVRVDSLRIVGAEASYADLTPNTPFRRRMGPVELTLTGFRTHPDSRNPYAFSGSTESGEKFSWSGHFSLDPLRSRGEVAVEDLSLAQYAALYQDFVKFEVRDGIVDVRGTYAAAFTGSNDVATVTNASLHLRSFKLGEKGNATHVAELADLHVTNVSADLLARWAEIESLSLTGGQLLVSRSSNATVNLVDLAQPGGTNVSGSILYMLRSVTNLFAQFLSSTNAGRAVIREIQVRDCKAAFEDLANPRPLQFMLTDFALAATNLSNLPGSNFTASASLRWQTNGLIQTHILASLSPPIADLGISLHQLDLTPLGPYLDRFVSVFIVGSRLSMDGRVLFQATNELGPDATFTGQLQLEDFASVDGETGEELLKFESVGLSNITARLSPPEVSMEEVAVRDAVAQVALETNGTLNLLRIARPTDTNAATVAGTNAPATKKSFADLRRQFGSMLRLYSTTNLSATNVPVKVSVATVVLSNATVLAVDRSLTPPVTTSLRNINGRLLGFSSQLDQDVSLKLHTDVAGTGPVDLDALMPAAGGQTTNRITITVRNVDLLPAGSYAGKFLGYGLRKGKVDLDVHYQMTARKLRAQNVLVLDQFTLGEKVESTNATKLPIKLAVAILKDRNGRIELDIPIEGDLDDPQFRLGKVITRTIGNILVKLATSPFAALGKVFGGKGEDVRYQEFDPGRSDLLPASVDKLDSVVNGLYERPGLELEIEGNVDLRADGEMLRQDALRTEMKKRKWASLRKSEQERLSVEAVTLAPEEYARLLEEMHAALIPSGEKSVRAAKAPSRSAKGASALVQNREPVSPEVRSDLERQLLELMQVPAEAFRALASNRAARVKEYILKSDKIEPERIVVPASPSTTLGTNGSRVYLRLQ